MALISGFKRNNKQLYCCVHISGKSDAGCAFLSIFKDFVSIMQISMFIIGNLLDKIRNRIGKAREDRELVRRSVLIELLA